MITDMTKDNPSKVLWKFSIPLFISTMFQQFYNMADSIIAGKYIGEDALSAVSASYPITMIFMAFAMGTNIGCSVVISQFFGAKKNNETKTAISTSFITSVVMGLLLTVVGVALGEAMLKMLGTPKNIMNDSKTYLMIYTIGLIFLFVYNICTGIFTALGDSMTPLYLLMGSSVGNIILDLVFVINFKLGVAGVAWATFFAQGAAAFLATILLTKKVKNVQCEKKAAIYSLEMNKKILIFAVPSILQQSFISVGNLIIQGLINGYGSSVMAGYAAAIKLNTFMITSLTTLSNGLSNYTGQNIGAKKNDRVSDGLKTSYKMSLCVAIPIIIVYLSMTKTLVGFFMPQTSVKAINVGVQFLHIVSPFYVVIAVKLMADGVLRGAGAMKPFMIATFTDLILRVILAFVLSVSFGTNGIWMSWPVGWTIAAGISLMFYKSGIWKAKSFE